MEATPDAPIPATSPYSSRSMGAVLGGVIALGSIATVYVTTAVGTIDDALPIREILSPSGATPEGSLLTWGVAPMAAAIAGWRVAPAALGRALWAGSWMGFLTYWIAIAISPFAMYGMYFVSDLPDGALFASLGDAIMVLPLVWIFAAVLLAPLFGLCLVAGTVWASALRSVVPDVEDDTETRDWRGRGPIIVATAVVLAVLWAGVVMLVVGIFSGGELAD